MVSRCSHKLVATLPAIYMSLSVILKSCHACLSHSCKLRCLHAGMHLLQNVGHMAQVICPSTRCLDVPFPVFVGTTCTCILLVLVHAIPHFQDMYHNCSAQVQHVPAFSVCGTCTVRSGMWGTCTIRCRFWYMYLFGRVLVHVPRVVVPSLSCDLGRACQ